MTDVMIALWTYSSLWSVICLGAWIRWWNGTFGL